MHNSVPAFGVAFVLTCSCMAATTNPTAPTAFDIPRLAGITIDGNAADWGDRGFRVDAMVENAGVPRRSAEFDARFRLGWDDRGLLALFIVHDPTPIETDRDDRLWNNDSLELCLSTGWGNADRYKVVIAPGLDPRHPKLRFLYTDQRKDTALKAVEITGQAARTTLPDGYVLEVLFPWSNLAIKPEIGREIAFRADINDQTDTTKFQCSWFRSDETGSSKQMQPLRLAEQASPPVQAVVAGGYERFRGRRVTVVAAPALVGQTVSVRDEDRELATTALAADGPRAFATLRCPMPPRGQPGKPLTVLVNAKPVQTLVLPDAEAARAKAFADIDIVSRASIFNSEAFPTCDFEQPAAAEDLIGPYTISCAFYNSDFESVPSATKPGRYGAVATIHTEDGKQYVKYCTLYHSARSIDERRGAPLSVTAQLPESWDVSPQVAQEQSRYVSEAFRKGFVDTSRHGSGPAILLSWLHEIRAGAGPQPERNSPAERDRIWWYQLRKKLGLVPPLQYLSYLPKDYDADHSKRWPLVLSLHGGEGVGTDMNLVKKNGLVPLAIGGKEFPFILIAPQCPPPGDWLPVQLNDFLDELASKYRIDPDRIYLTGFSMGGYGTWAMIQQYPDRFAAAIPICGLGDPGDVARIKDLPIWVFHGAKDASVNVRHSREMIEALKKIGSGVHYTEYPEVDHDSWTPAYATPELQEWMLQQHRHAPSPTSTP